MGGYEILLYYWYTRLGDPEGFVKGHRALCEELGLRGRILVAWEGINGTVSGERWATERYRELMGSSELFGGMEFKIDEAEGHVFPRLSVKVRPELVALGLGKADIDPRELTGKRVGAGEFLEAVEAVIGGDPGVVVLDARNRYEWEVGRFRGAICPEVEHFRDLPRWVEEHRSELEGKRIFTYCTGGVRCEKFSGWLAREGFGEVAQLDGGIVSYGRDAEVRGKWFDGGCYVFDGRMVAEVNRTGEAVKVGRCCRCGVEEERIVNCRGGCGKQILLCEACEEVERGCGGSACAQR
jgi:UPF0176 protein